MKTTDEKPKQTGNSNLLDGSNLTMNEFYPSAITDKPPHQGTDHAAGPSEGVKMLGVPHGRGWLWERIEGENEYGGTRPIDERSWMPPPPAPPKWTDCGVPIDTGKKPVTGTQPSPLPLSGKRPARKGEIVFSECDCHADIDHDTLLYLVAGLAFLLSILAIALCYAMLKSSL